MSFRFSIAMFVFVTFLSAPAVAGMKSQSFVSNKQTTCKKMVAAKHVPKGSFQDEYTKCLDNPTTYQ
jgi:hypothetical protein